MNLNPIKEPGFRLIGHAHIDPVWRWTKSEGIAEVLATFRSAISRLQEFPQVAFVASSAQFYEWVRIFDPDLFGQIKDQVSAGRWNLVGGWWVEADVNIPDGESIVRQGLLAQRFFLEHFGRKARCGFSPDTFGHPHTLPQILAGQSLQAYFFLRPEPMEKPNLPGLIFNWTSPDQTQILTFQILDAYCGEEEQIEHRLKMYSSYEPLPYAIFYGVGNHGGGPTVATIKKIQHLAEENPQIQFSSLDSYVDEIRQLAHTWPVVTEDLHNHSRGCYSAAAEIKQLMQHAETSLLTAEKFSVMAAMLLARKPKSCLSSPWQKLLFNQFHDILCGTSIETACEQSRAELYSVISAADHCLDTSCRWMAEALATEAFGEATSPFVLFNPHSFPLSEWVEVELQHLKPGCLPRLVDADGTSIPYQAINTAAVHVQDRLRIVFRAELPAMGFRAFALDFSQSPAPAAAGVTMTDTTMENEHLAIRFNRATGFIESIYDKTNDREFLSAPAAGALVIADRDDTWGHQTLAYDEVIGQFEKPLFTVLEQGPERCRLQVEHYYEHSLLQQEYSLTRACRHLDVQVRVLWREYRKMLKLSFPSVLKDGTATFSAPFGFIERTMNGEEQPGQTWLDISGRDDRGAFGMSLFSEGKYGYSVLAGEIRMTVLHSPIWSHHQPQSVRPEDGYRPMEQGLHSFRYRLVPHEGDWRVAGSARQASAFLRPALCLLTHRHPGSLPLQSKALEIDNDQILVVAMKPAEMGEGYVLRCLETVGKDAKATIKAHVGQRRFSACFRPCEIKSFFIPFDPSLEVYEVNLLEEPLITE